MISFPIVERELRLAARRPSTYRTRFWAALIVMLIAGGMIATSRQPTAQVGKQMFVVLAALAYGSCLLAGVRYTADSLSEEKRSGTLGLLFLTDLRGYDVVFGKLAVTSLQSFYGLLAVLPILALPLLFGSVTGAEFWRMSLLLVNTLIFSLSIGLLISAVGRDERQVMLGTFLTLLLFAFGFPGLWKSLNRIHDSRWWDVLFLFPSPTYAFRMCSDPALRSMAAEYNFTMATIGGLSALFIATASVLLPRVFQERHATKRSRWWAEWFQNWRFSRSQGRLGSQANDLRGIKPDLWLTTRDRLPALVGRLFAIIVIAFGCWAYWVFARKDRALAPIAMFGLYGFHLIFKTLVAGEACRRFNQDRHSGAMELLLGTSLQVDSLVRSQALAITYMLWPALLALFLVNAAAAMGMNENEFFEIAFGGAVVAVFDMLAITWVGMWVGLRSQSYRAAVFGTLGRVMLPAWAPVVLFIFATMGGGARGSTVEAFFKTWLVLSAVYDFFLVTWARWQLLAEFRTAASLDHVGSIQRQRFLPPIERAVPPHQSEIINRFARPESENSSRGNGQNRPVNSGARVPGCRLD